jgi:hypothetical protein
MRTITLADLAVTAVLALLAVPTLAMAVAELPKAWQGGVPAEAVTGGHPHAADYPAPPGWTIRPQG